MTKSVSEEILKGLMLLSLDGDEAAYRRLLTVLRDLLLIYYRKRLGSRVEWDVEDLVQEVLLALHNRRITFDRDRPFTAWFFQIARYKLVDHLRITKRKSESNVELDDELAGDFREEALFAHLDVDRLLDQLPLKQRELLRQVKLFGNTTAETAVNTGQSEVMVRVSIHRSIREIGRRLGFANDK